MARSKKSIVYVVGAGFSAGLGFPTIRSLLQDLWPDLEAQGIADEIADVIRFHHPNFNAALPDTFPNIEQLLSEMKANEELFDSSRPATGKFTVKKLRTRRKKLLLAVADRFHALQRKALRAPPPWLTELVERMKAENAQIISFNWDLVLDELLFEDDLSARSYALTGDAAGPRLIKPHGSLNWYRESVGRHLKRDRVCELFADADDAVLAFKFYRAPKSSRRRYMPLIVPPVFSKDFSDPLFRPLWREAVAALSTAAEVNFLGFSLADADFHARFILRCGFHNQLNGALLANGRRSSPTGQAQVTVVDIADQASANIERAVGWPTHPFKGTVEEWVNSWPVRK